MRKKKYAVKVGDLYLKNLGGLYDYIILEDQNWTRDVKRAAWWYSKPYVELLAKEFIGGTVIEVK